MRACKDELHQRLKEKEKVLKFLKHLLDSLLHGNTSPKMQSTFPFGKVSTFPRQQASPQQSLVVESSPSIVSLRFWCRSVPATDRPLPISGPSSQLHSPDSLFCSNSSPAGSAHSLRVLSSFYDSDGNAWVFQTDIQSDSDASLLGTKGSCQDTDGCPAPIPDFFLLNVPTISHAAVRHWKN